MIAFVASATHYVDHLAPVYHALDATIRGPFLVPGALADHTMRAGITPTLFERFNEARMTVAGMGAVVVASFGDLRDIRGARRPVIYMEHGAGQSYHGDRRSAGHPAFAGARDRRGVALFLTPGPAATEANARAHPEIPIVEVGAPKLDLYHRTGIERRLSGARRPVVAITFHWPCRIVPETLSAWPHYMSHLGKLARDPHFQLLGHAHPRADRSIQSAYRAYRVERAVSLGDVFERADVLVADNTSALYEFASLGKPTVVLNAPWYRKRIDHDLRFWNAATGVQVDHGRELPDAITYALTDPEEQRVARATAVARAYAHTDGRAAISAAAAITDWYERSRPTWDHEVPARRRARSSAPKARRARAASDGTSRSLE